MGEPAAAGGRRGRRRALVVAVLAVVVVVGGLIALAGGGDDVGGTPGVQAPVTSGPDRAGGEPGVTRADPATTVPDAGGSAPGGGLATSGPRFEQGAKLLAELVSVVPADFTVPAAESAGRMARRHQARLVQETDGVEVWVYEASLAVSAGSDTGMLVVTVATPGWPRPAADVCAAIAAEPDGECERVGVGGRGVVVLSMVGETGGLQRAEFTHPDGTVVSVLQTPDSVGDGRNVLPQPVFSPRRLAELAADDRFRVV